MAKSDAADTAPDQDRDLKTFADLRRQIGWPEAVREMVTQTRGRPSEQRQDLYIALAGVYQSEYPRQGADTELQRKQLARQFGELITSCGGETSAGTARLLINLARRAGDYDVVVELGLDLARRHPKQIHHAHQMVGNALFNLKRHDEALAYLFAIPEQARNDSTKALLARMSAGDTTAIARAQLLAAFALADDGKAAEARDEILKAAAAVHPGLAPAALAHTAAILAELSVNPVPDPDGAAAVDGVTPLFCSGFRWSGASAVYDFLAQQSQVAMFWRRPRFMQDSGSAFEGLLETFHGPREEVLAAVRAFFAEQILGIALKEEKKNSVLKTLENSILRQLEPGTDLGVFDSRLASFFAAVLDQVAPGGGARAFPDQDFAAAMRALSALCRPGARNFVLFDSVIRAAQAGMLCHIPGAKMVAVIRDPRDMYVTHVERGNWSKGVKPYIRELKELFGGFEQAMKDPVVANACHAVRFEQFVQDESLRADTLRWLGMDPSQPSAGEPRFVPEQSALNIGIYRGFADQDALRALEKAFPFYCRGAAAPADRVKVLTFSPMATRRQQMDQMGVAGKPGEPGWARRRQITVNLLADGAYDFFGLQHCYRDPGGKYDAVTYFQEGLAARGLDYGIVNRTAGADPDKGDSTPLYYRQDRWELDGEEQGFVWFQTPQPAEDAPGGGGLLFVFGLFHEKTTDGGRSGRKLYVYNVRLRNQHSDEVDAYRARCFLEITQHMAARKLQDVPVILLGDTNTKMTDSLADRVMRGQTIEIAGESLAPQMALRDALLTLHPDMHGTVRTQHDFRRPGKLPGSDRNSRIFCDGLEVVSADIMTVNEGGMFPSYHYPVQALLRF